jgi:ATP-dependent RNA helicase DeaD
LEENLKEKYEKKLEELLAEAGVMAEEEESEDALANEYANELEDEAATDEDGSSNEQAEEGTGAKGTSGVDDANMDDIRDQLDPRIQRALDDMGFAKLTPIQEQAIPALLSGQDIIGQAQTGTGKTAAFGIPLISRVDASLEKLQAVVLCPTRELAIQAALELRKIAKYIEGLRILPVYGGQEIGRQIRALPGTQIIVGTPGRVMDHMNRHTIKLDNVSMVVLDEADEMLNMGFREDMEVILGAIPGEHQTALFSATMPKPILEITGKFQKEDTKHIRIATGELTIPLISQKYFLIKNADKDAATVRLLEYYDPRLCLIFCNTKAKVEELSEVLKKADFQAEGLHGDLIQHQRDIVMGRFRNGSTNILIATDVAARGIDVDDVEIVINYDVPLDNEYYVHRIGRTGRAGKTGMSFTFANARELHRIREIEKFCKTTIEEKKLPDASKVLKSKARKVLNTAWELKDHEDIELMKVYLQRKMEKDGCDILDLAACMLKREIGDKGEEILEDKPQPRQRGFRDRGRGFGRRDEEGREGRGFGRRDGEGRGFGRRDGEGRGFGHGEEEGREGGRRRRGFGRRDEEVREGRGFGREEGFEGRSFDHTEERKDREFGRREDREDRSLGRRDEEGHRDRSEKKRDRRENESFSEKIFGKKQDRQVKFWEMEKPDFVEMPEELEKHFAKKERKGSKDSKGAKDAKSFRGKDSRDSKGFGGKSSKDSKGFGGKGSKDSKSFGGKKGKDAKGAGKKDRKGSRIDARSVLDVDKFGRPKRVKR